MPSTPRKTAAPLTPPDDETPAVVIHTPDASLTADPPVLAPETDTPPGPTPTPVIADPPLTPRATRDSPTAPDQVVDLQRQAEQLRAERDAAREERDAYMALLYAERAARVSETQAAEDEGRWVTPTNPHVDATAVRDAPLSRIQEPRTATPPLT